MSTCIVTCIYDLISKCPEYIHRSPQEYASMLEYHRDLGYPVVCFTESHLVQYLPDFVKPYVVEYDDLPTHELIALTGKGYSNAMIGDVLHEGHRLYSIVTNSKIFLMSLLVGFDTYIWLDSGMEHGDAVTLSIARETLEDVLSDPKSRLNLINYPTHVNLDVNMYNVASNMFSIKGTDMDLVLSKYKEYMLYVKSIGYICLEEQIFSLVYSSIPNTFSVRFTDYRPLSNGGKYIRLDVDVIMRNIHFIPHNMKIDLSNMFLNSISTGNLRLSQDQLLHYIIMIMDYSQVCHRILYHCLKFKNHVNNPNYKSRFDIVLKINQYGIKDKIKCTDIYDTMFEYLKNSPLDRTIIRSLL